MADHLTNAQFIAYVTQTTTDATREELDQHLQKCAACRARLAEHTALVRRLRYGLGGHLDQLPPAREMSFTAIAPKLKQSRRWMTFSLALSRGVGLAGQVAIWVGVLCGLIFVWMRLNPEPPQPPASPPPLEASFTNRQLQVFTAQPVLSPGPAGAWDASWVEPGGVTYAGGRFHLIYYGGNSGAMTSGLGYAVSTDGLHWQRPLSSPVITPGAIVSSTMLPMLAVNSLLTDGKQWELYFTLGDVQSPVLGTIHRATAPSPEGPWRVEATPVLLPGDKSTADWDAFGVGEAAVVRTAQGYVMYYTGGFYPRGIGRATSPDGRTWTKYDDPATTAVPFIHSDPMLSSEADWEGSAVGSPTVWQTPTRWVMAYVAGPSTGVGYAVSADGLHWLKSPANPIVSPAKFKESDYFTAQLTGRGQTAFLYFGLRTVQNPFYALYAATWQEP